ncbi:MAG: 4-phosphoerythronate dehydrogenase [Nitrospira sp. SB0667_bin_9]|nr:4-phosphoerythronate dehydrogenase [Nitrospira sp. SB0667_bin_9]MYD30301.1 4-phosphoerythronate dehydrogenase [Nitrospira sp. SB0661_bin_20]MYJ21973.1 4-phosphoerythronate dehydrogenase [Nitrospira sp. SB0673_bin_12]
MQFVVDENIPFAREAFSHLGSVTLLPGRGITREVIRHADALIVRSVTKVDAVLLADTNVQFVGTATTGVEHVDREYLAARNVAFASALGCNANAVAEYVLTALLVTAHAKGLSLSGKTLGIIGAGRIGSLVAAKAAALGLRTLLHDPPLARATGEQRYLPLAEILRADFMTLHVPLTYDGPDATFHLIGADELAHVTPSAILINTARGEVVDNAALLETLTKGTIGGAVMDVWEGEPAINWDLLDRATFGTPHVAGYSSDGKINGTVMVYHACCRFRGIEPVWAPPDPPAAPAPGSLPHLEFDATGKDFQVLAHDVLTTLYDLPADHEQMRDVLAIPESLRPQAFDRLRRDYPHRREFAGTRVSVTGGGRNLFARLQTLGIRADEP